MNWMVFSLVLIISMIGIMYWRFERRGSDAKEVALVATLSSLAGISRVPFAAIMSFQPTTFIIMISGYVFGPEIGFVIGATAAFISNFFLGQGPWTPWQMCSWGLCGVLAGMLGIRKATLRVLSFTVLAAFCGYLFGWIMNIWHWLGFVYPLNFQTFIATYSASFIYDSIHAGGNALFSFMFALPFHKILMRFKRRLHVEVERTEE